VILASIILALKKKYPKVRFIADFSYKTSDIFRENIHIAFRSTEHKKEPYLAPYICKDEYTLCASRDFLEQHKIIKSLEYLNNHQMIVFTKKGSVIDRFEFTYQQQVVQHNVSSDLSFNSKNAIYKAVMMDCGIAILLKYLVAKELISGGIIEVHPKYKIKGLSFYALYTQRRKESALVNTFIDYVCDTINADSDIDK
jgi:DNA-binding transcriptional LysR family regulator